MSYEMLRVNNYLISVEFVPTIIRIVNDTSLKNMIKNTSRGAVLISKLLRYEYKIRFKEDINISVNSLAIEILGHIYPDNVSKAIKNIPLISHLANEILSHTDIIDCGENDIERPLWNILSPFYNIISLTINPDY